MSDTPRTDALADKMPTRTMDEGILLDHARQLERDNAALLAANKDCLAHFDSLKADYDALRRHADNMALAIECAEGFEARDLDFAFDYRQWSKGK